MEAPFPDEQSPEAYEGTLAHGMAELILKGEDHTGLAQEIREAGYDPDQMYRDVLPYVEHVESLDGQLECEVRVSLAPLDPPSDMFGTVDAMVWDPLTETLHIRDLKFGQGVVVEIDDDEGRPNPQAMYYLLGSVLKLGRRPKNMTIGIVQPRAFHPDGHVRVRVVSWDELVQFRHLLLARAREASKPDAPVGPVGDHCRFCKAKAVCPAQRKNAVVLAQTEFDTTPNEPALPAPEGLTEDQLVAILERGKLVEDWISSVREYALTRLSNGGDVPGFKLVEGRRSRQWRDNDEAEAWLRQRYKVGDIFNKKLISPAQAEKLVKDRPRLEIPDEMILVNAGKPKLAPADSPKPALNSGEEFPTLEAEV